MKPHVSILDNFSFSRYYYEKNIITKIPGKRYSYRFDIFSLLAEGYSIPNHIHLPAFLTTSLSSPPFLTTTHLMAAAALDHRLWIQAQQSHYHASSVLPLPRVSPSNYYSPLWTSAGSMRNDSSGSGSCPTSPLTSGYSGSPLGIGPGLGHIQSLSSPPPSSGYHQGLPSSGLVHFQDPQYCYSACANLGTLSRGGEVSPARWLSPIQTDSTPRMMMHRDIGRGHRFSPY